LRRLGVVGEYLILDIAHDEVEFEDWDDGSGWLAALAPLRAEVLAGDYRLFYLLWLTAVETDAIEADELELMPGIGPMTGALEAFTNFFGIDSDLVQAAAERSATSNSDESLDSARRVIAAMTEREKTGLLDRLFAGDPHVVAELRSTVRKRLESETGSSTVPRTAGELRGRARAIRLCRERIEANKASEERRRQIEAAEKVRQTRLEAIRRRGESAWRKVEDEIERRNSSSYDRAAALLTDLRALAEKQGTIEDFLRRLHEIRGRYVRKERFIKRLAAIG